MRAWVVRKTCSPAPVLKQTNRPPSRRRFFPGFSMSTDRILPTVHVLFENPSWLPPLVAGLKAEGFPVRLVEVVDGSLDPDAPPPEGIWLNRISPSSHTRGHGHSVELAREYLAWLESWGRRVVNGSSAFELEMSKLRQHLALRRHGITAPRTVLGVGASELVALARTFTGPFITKHNRGGKGLGIALFRTAEELASRLEVGEFDLGPDGKIVLQEYITAPAPFITRVEIVGGRFLFAMRSATDAGFELCPSDACQAPLATPDVCPADGLGSKFGPSPLTAADPLVAAYVRLCEAEGIEVAGIEFIEDRDGRRYTYDINGTTNYSGVLGARIGVDGMREVARYLRREVVPTLARGEREGVGLVA